MAKAIQVNTILWGGVFNAIVPVFTRTPKNWMTRRTANEIVRGYLDAFEPDFIVASDAVDATRFGIERRSIIRLDAMLTREGLAERGTDAMSIYRSEYERVFQFVQRRPVPLIMPKTADRALELFTAASFGAFPRAPLGYFAEGFRDLGGEEIRLTTSNYLKHVRTGVSPLELVRGGLDRRGSTGPRRTFFLLDPASPGDLIDFWNLRALGWRIIAIPLQWAGELAAQVATVIRTKHQPDARLQPWVTRAHILRGRSVTGAAIRTFATDIGATGETVVIQDFVPRIWEPAAREADFVRRIEVSALADEQKVEVHGDTISFQTLGPEFVERSIDGTPRFANVIELRSYELPELANLIPKEIQDVDGLLRGYLRANMMRLSSEGVSILTRGDGESIVWHLPHGLRVFTEWFKPIGKVRLSGAGKIARRMIGLIGGPDRARLVTDVDVVRLLGSAVETASRDIPHERLFALLMKLERNSKEVAERRIQGMLRQNVIKLGLRLPCELCAQQNWFALGELREKLSCQWCLDSLPFPTAMPPKQPCWSYRPLGPFGAKGFAHGSYVVTAAIRLFRSLGSGARTTWVPSFTLETANGSLEADFGVLWEGNEFQEAPRQLVLGECKTFDEFRSIDVLRMKALAKTFPHAVLVFATFNAKLSEAEKNLIGPLAHWGRTRWRNPVMVLTARELTADLEPPHCWQEDGTERELKMFEAVRRAPAPHVSLRRLADATQQLYLDAPVDENWPHYMAP